MRRFAKAISLLTLTALISCGEVEVMDSGASIDNAQSAKGDRGEEGLTPYERAIAVLVDVAENGETEIQRALAAETVARIEAEDVLVARVEDARGEDLWHMCMDLMPETCGPRPADGEWSGTEKMRAAIVADLDGYQWGNRLYFTLSDDLDPRAFAATLVHEVNHVLNRSECSYYRDFDSHMVDQTRAFMEEFRAFYAECWLEKGAQATVDGCREQAVHTLTDLEYDMTPDFEELMPGEFHPLEQISEELIESRFWEEGSFGYLVPSQQNWPEDFTPCD
jgi:hypothetical protein